MEDEEGKVQVNELDLGFYIIHVFSILLPCGCIESLEYIEWENNQIDQIKRLLWVLNMS
jgi:hypothetical protein